MPKDVHLDTLIDHYVDHFSSEETLILLKVLASPDQGGMGYTLSTFDPGFDLDGWEVDTTKKTIKIDTSGIFSSYTPGEMAQTLKEAIQTEILNTRPSILSRIGWGTGKVLIGVIETGVGLIGILVPEPGTTAAGVGMVALGANSLGDGFSQLMGANNDHGYNVLGMAFGNLGAISADVAGYDVEVGRNVGRNIFVFSSIVFGSVGSIKILNIKSTSSIRLGVGGQPGGLEVGRLAMGYRSNRAKDGMTVINISNNSGQWLLRFVTHNGRLVVNGRIVGIEKILKHEDDWREIAKGLLKLLVHGAKSSN